MKFLIVFTCALAAASAAYEGPQHIPVIGPNGVPVDTTEVQQARANHFAQKVEAVARNGDVAYAAPYYPTYAPFAYSAYAAPAIFNGVPLETPEVVAAKANHFAAHAEALARTGHPAVLYRKRRALAPVAYSAVASPLAYSAVASPLGYSAVASPLSYSAASPLAYSSVVRSPVHASTYGAYPYAYSSPLSHYY